VTAVSRKLADLVLLSGGGVKCVGLVGAVVALMDAGYTVRRVYAAAEKFLSTWDWRAYLRRFR
jgi:hypothetical protein